STTQGSPRGRRHCAFCERSREGEEPDHLVRSSCRRIRCWWSPGDKYCFLEKQIVAGLTDLALVQEDGNSPTTLVAGSAPGESGVSLRFVRFQDGLHLSGTVRQHVICFQLAQACFDCRIGSRTLRHEPPAGSVAICPAGVDCAADAKGSIDAVFVAVDPRY